MADLRELLSGAGYPHVRTYVQSGNVVLGSDAQPAQLERDAAALISARLGFEVAVIVRTRDELAEVVARNPLGDIATEPKRYQVSFMSAALDGDRVAELEAVAQAPERLVVIGREAYAWHPEGVARSKLSIKLTGRGLGVTATARNWTTVTTLLGMADE